ncbi:MAG: GDYXXLXY domain-containing protein [Chthoniobacteraceae bacterium]
MNLRAGLLCVVLLIQCAVPGWMIFDQEQTLRHGVEYRFQTEPVDPYDFFRGRYVALRFKAADLDLKGGPDIPWASTVYVAVKPNAEGFAEIERYSLTPIAGDNVFRAKAQGGLGSKTVRLEFPFAKFFMDEKLAPEAEKAYREANRRNGGKPSWAVVRLRHGKAALVDLVIDGQPIREYLRTHSK